MTVFIGLSSVGPNFRIIHIFDFLLIGEEIFHFRRAASHFVANYLVLKILKFKHPTEFNILVGSSQHPSSRNQEKSIQNFAKVILNHFFLFEYPNWMDRV